MTAAEILQRQDQIVTTLANAIREPWKFVVVNIEIDVIDGDQTENCIVLSYTKKLWRLIQRSEELPHELYDQFAALRDHMAESNDSSWGSCTLVFEKSGRYRFEFSYEPPSRLNGIHDEDSMMAKFDPAAFLNRDT